METTIKSKYGQDINVACMSCKFMEGAGDMRTCMNPNGRYFRTKVMKTAKCGNYIVRHGLMNAGKGGGMIKTKNYLYRHLDYVAGECKDKDELARLEKMKASGEAYVEL